MAHQAQIPHMANSNPQVMTCVALIRLHQERLGEPFRRPLQHVLSCQVPKANCVRNGVLHSFGCFVGEFVKGVWYLPKLADLCTEVNRCRGRRYTTRRRARPSSSSGDGVEARGIAVSRGREDEGRRGILGDAIATDHTDGPRGLESPP